MTGNGEPVFKGEFANVPYVPLPPPEAHPMFDYDGFKPGTTTLKAGYKKDPSRRAFGVDTIYERDVGITVRDGAILYADIFRPAAGDKVPAILPWSPYGKSGTGFFQYDRLGANRCGVPADATSGYDKFEAPCPAVWAERGYATVNVDARGAGDSEGDLVFWEAEDIYDVIDWISNQEWCNGSVVMAGNSWLAVAQFNFASRMQHPALKAIAPWEGATDMYKDLFMRGGRVHLPLFNNAIIMGLAGRGMCEAPAMAAKYHPLLDEYWQDKQAKVENIDVPMYVVASYSTCLHARGSLDAYVRARSKNKWLRFHPHQEWHDLHRSEMVDDLQKFYDHFAKGVDNGWDKTPTARVSLLAFEGSSEKTIVERPYTAYPPFGTKHQKVYLSASGKTLESDTATETSSVSHDSHHLTASSDFTLYFDKRTELHGLPKVKLWMSSPHDDMDVAVQIRKIDAAGKPMKHLNYPCPADMEVPEYNVSWTTGPEGYLRVSHAHSKDEAASDDINIVYKHDSSRKLTPGEVVPFEITLWPIGMVIGAGEGIMLRVSGHSMVLPEFPQAVLKEPLDENVGEHTIWTGGKYDSHLVLPVLPEA